MANIAFIAECTNVVQGMKNKMILTPEGDYYRPSTIKNISDKINNFLEYQEHLGGVIYLGDINYPWVETYMLFLLDKGYAKNTVGAILANLKAFIKRFHKMGLTLYSGAGIRAGSEITTAVANTIAELQQLLAIDLSATPGRERIRDFYVAHCFTGLRIKDMCRLAKNIEIHTKEQDSKTFLEVKTNKNGEVVVIPAAPILLNILKKRGNTFGRPFSEQYYRRELKLLFSTTGMDRQMLFHRTEGGERRERIVLFSSLLGTHSARRSFATNAYLMGINPVDIMKITGHRSFNSFIRYIRCENMAVALRISSHEFFQIE